MTKKAGGFKNIKLGKNVYRQLKRRGVTPPLPDRNRKPDGAIYTKDKPNNQ